MTLARAQRRLVMVDLYTDWCVWCKKLDSDVYTDPAVEKEVARGFVPLKLNPEKQKEGADLAAKHAVQGYPCILFLDSSGKLVSRLDGFVPAEQFVKVLKDARKAALEAGRGA
jgi:thiol:disulfide interchange protein